MISQAKLNKANCIAENNDSYDKRLTRRVIQRPKAKLFLLGIHKTVEHRSNSKPEILAHSDNQKLSSNKDDSILHAILSSISRIQNSVLQLENWVKEQQHFPFEGRGPPQMQNFHNREDQKQQKCFQKKGRIQSFQNNQNHSINNNNFNLNDGTNSQHTALSTM